MKRIFRSKNGSDTILVIPEKPVYILEIVKNLILNPNIRNIKLQRLYGDVDFDIPSYEDYNYIISIEGNINMFDIFIGNNSDKYMIIKINDTYPWENDKGALYTEINEKALNEFWDSFYEET